MNIFSIILTTVGLTIFEVVSSIDNAVINAEVLSTMGQKARKFFLFWGLLLSVFLIRGLLPWLIIWASTPSLGPLGALTATFSNDPKIAEAVKHSAPILLIAGGTFLILLFFNWLFLEEKNFGLIGERFFRSQSAWFYAVAALTLTIIVWFALKEDPLLGFGSVVGSTVFFITHGFKQNAEQHEENLLKSKNNGMSDYSKILYLEIIDATFSIDGVLGAFAFTLSVPLILIGTGIGAVVVRQLTITNIEKVKKYIYLENGAMYSLLILGFIMLLGGFGYEIPDYISPIITLFIISYFFLKSKSNLST